jgi:hypothetical protein
MQSCDYARMTVKFVTIALKVVMPNDGDFVDVILLQEIGCVRSTNTSRLPAFDYTSQIS